MKLRAKILVPVLLVLFVAAVLTILSVSIVAQVELKQTLYTDNENISWRYAKQIESDLMVSINSVRNTAELFTTMKSRGVVDRKAYDEVLIRKLKSNSLVLGSWTIWEPNTLDGKDKDFVNTKGSDATGRYVI